MGYFRAYLAEQSDDSPCYNILAKTKKELVDKMKANDHITYHRAAYCGVRYSDLHDLVDLLTCEAGGRTIDWPFDVIREYDVDELLNKGAER